MYGVWDLNSAAQVSIFLNTGNTPSLSLSFLTCLTLTSVNSAILSSEKPIDFIWENSSDVFGKPFIKLKGPVNNFLKKKIKRKKYDIYLSLSDDKPWAHATEIISYI